MQNHSKCAASTSHHHDSHLHSPDHSSSMLNSSHYTYPPSSPPNPLFQPTNLNFYNSSLSPMGTPFFTLLSGPPSFSQYHSQQIFTSNHPSNPSTNVHAYNTTSIVPPTGHESSFASSKLLLSQNVDNHHLNSQIDIRPLVPVSSLPSAAGNTAVCLHEQSNAITPLKNMPPQHGKLHNSSVHHQLSLLPSVLPRVFCLYASGDLFLSNNGLLGVVCSCHGFRMSISKFSEHAGLQDVNSGDAVHMDSGETIAQWRKVYFSKFGIRIPEDQCGWNWPEGYSTAADATKSNERVPNETKSVVISNSVIPSRPHAASRQPLIFPDHHCSNQKLVHALDNHKLPNGLTEMSKSNAHGTPANKIIEQHASRCLSMSALARGTDINFKSVPTYSYKKINNYRDGNVMEKHMVPSNIELRLGQPSQQNQTLGKSKAPGLNTCVRRVGQKLVSSHRLIYNDAPGSNKFTEEIKQVVNCAAQAAESGSTEEQSRLRFSCLGFGAYSTRIASQPEQLKGDEVAGSVSSMLFSHFNDPKDKMSKQQYVESQISKLGYNDMEHYKLTDKGKGLEHVNNGFPIPVTSRHVSPRPSSIPRAPSMVFSSMVMNPSPNMTSSMSTAEGTRVLNSRTPSSNVSSFRGVEKDQNVSGNPISGSFWSSTKVPSKSTAYTYNPPELATKPVHTGTTSWAAKTAEQSAVISASRETYEMQSNPYQTGHSLPRIGITEDICSSSGHGNCFQGTSHAYVPKNRSFLIQKTHMAEISNLDGKTFLSAFGEPSKIKAPILSTSTLQKGCTSRNGVISLSKIGEAIKTNIKKVEFNAFQWKDVPNKMAGKCNGSCRDETANFLEDRVNVINETSVVVVKSVEQPVQKVDCMKEQVMSNVLSKCSAPALTQASVKISNGDSCTDDAQNTDCGKNWSSDDCSNTGFIGVSSKNDSINGTESKSVPDRSTRSLVDELRVIDSLRLKKVQIQSPRRENGISKKTFVKEFESRKGETKFKIVGRSFPASPISSISTGSSGQSSQSLEDVHKLDNDKKKFPCKTPKRVYDDLLENPDSPCGKKVRIDLEFSKTKCVWKEEVPCKRFTRPVVCGRYGLISNGDTSKPAKIFSLKRIIKISKRCSPVGDEFVKKSPVKPLKKSIIREGNRQTDRFFSFKEDKCHIGKGAEVYSDDDTTESSDSDFGTKKRRKSKKIRKRSLYELITEEKDSSFATFPKNKASVSQDNLKNGGNSNNFHGGENISRSRKELTCKSTPDVDNFCNVCGSFNNDELNFLLECNRCLIKVHQACYGISKIPKNDWYCRPCRENATNMACVLCGYEGGVMTRALHSNVIVRSLLNAWNVVTESQETQVNIDAPQRIICEHIRASSVAQPVVNNLSYPSRDKVITNSVTAGVFDPTVKQWVHMVCGLWTPDTRCPNVDTMSAFDMSGVCYPKGNVVCSMCKRPGGRCIRCRIMGCTIHFHPWCAHQKGLLQSEVEGVDNYKVGFYGRCELHATEDHCTNTTNSWSIQIVCLNEKETCARTEGYKGRKQEGFRHDSQQNPSGGAGCIVQQEQVDAWNYINQQQLYKKRLLRTPQTVQDVESDYRKEYARYKQSKGWKHLVVYKSGIHALGLYTSLFISQSAMVVEYVGEIVGLRVADRRETEYQSGKQLQYKSACYFFRIDKENIIDATRKGGIARFVNHSCEPNCIAKVITVRGEKKVVFFAERDIYPGEEITYDYHFNNEDEGKKIWCSCNSNNCRRYLN